MIHTLIGGGGGESVSIGAAMPDGDDDGVESSRVVD
jgi:hypothetical protein